MALDFDVLEFCRKLRTAKQPPYKCPIPECGKTYKSMCGLQYHLVNFDHNIRKEPVKDDKKVEETPTIIPSQPEKKKRSKKKKKKKRGRSSNTNDLVQKTPQPQRQPLSYSEAQKYVEFEIDDKIHRLLIDECIPIIPKQQYELIYPPDPNASTTSYEKPKELLKLPEPRFSLIEDYNIPDVPFKPVGYIRFIEKSPEDLDAEIEYDMDEEDAAWLDIMNDKRAESGLSEVSVDTFELLMDRLEKESYFQMQTTKGDCTAMVDEDAVCCICTDGECQNSNVILFCDMCNLAVHQDCYGVPYIPEGQWLCRRCLQSPSRAVDCVLCPNNGGAFKQTDRAHWAHVVCALWIPEVRFANTVFLEPIDSIETIPPARWKLTCYLCKQRGVGACIQCHKSNCYSAFHVTCAQQAGLYMKIDAIKDSHSACEGESAPVLVQKIAYCGSHTPADADNKPKSHIKKQQQQRKLPKNSAPVINIPTIPPDRIQEIASLVTIPKKNQFIQRIIAYWTIKRHLRNGVPLLRRLQMSQFTRRGDSGVSNLGAEDIDELRNQLKYYQCLRQDLERARLLCELVRKREKLKRELLKVKSMCLEMELCPLASFLRRLLDLIRARDTGEIFIEPVDQTEVPDYSEIVKHPMDLSTMRNKIDTFQYGTLQEFENDFYLMINNCLAYNSKDTVFFKAAIKMREQGGTLLDQARQYLQQYGLNSDPVTVESPDNSESDSKLTPDEPDFPAPTASAINKVELTTFDSELRMFTKDQITMTRKEKFQKLNNLLELAKTIKHGNARSKRIRLIKTLIAKVKRDRNEILETGLNSEVEAKAVKRLSPARYESKSTETVERKKRKEADSSFKGSNSEADTKTQKTLAAAYDSAESSSKATNDVDRKKRKGEESSMQDPCKKSITADKSTSTSASTVNRRSAVLFSKKTNTVSTSTQSDGPPLRRRGRPNKNASSHVNLANLSSLDSFKTYRSSVNNVKSDEESQSEEGSCCSDCSSESLSVSNSESCSEWSESGEDSNQNISMEALDQLQLVWAKCRGYPWYPALIINPKMPRGYVHNGVPIPSPPADVIALANNYTEPVYLVLFFDTKRTWQWLPRNKLEPLGISYELDDIKMTLSRKPADRKAVRKAYQDALAHRIQSDKKNEHKSAHV